MKKKGEDGFIHFVKIQKGVPLLKMKLGIIIESKLLDHLFEFGSMESKRRIFGMIYKHRVLLAYKYIQLGKIL